MNNPTLVDKLTGTIPGKTEGVSLITIAVSLIFGALHMFFGIEVSAEAIASIAGILVGLIGTFLGSRAKRVENTVNQVQAAQTATAETVIMEAKKNG